MLDAPSLKRRLLEARIATPKSIVGCSQAEIAQIQTSLHLKLPKAYVDVLRAIGKRAGAFLRDITFYFPKVLELRQITNEILDNWEEGKLTLPDKALVFAMRHGDQLMFFVGDGTVDDPPIWSYEIGSGGFIQTSQSIWDVLESELQLSEEFRRKYPNSPLIPDPE